MQRVAYQHHIVEGFGLFYPSYMCPDPVLCIKATGKMPRLRIKGPRECETKASKDIITPPSEPVCSPDIFAFSKTTIRLKDELGIVSIQDVDVPISTWQYLSSAEWQAELDRTPIGPCQPIPEDPRSWVHMSMKEIEDEFWRETLDFDGYQHVIDDLRDSMEGRTAVIEPRDAVSLLDSNHVPFEDRRNLMDNLHRFYMDIDVGLLLNILMYCTVQ